MSSRFLAVFLLTICSASLGYAQMQSNFFQQNQIVFNPAGLDSNTETEILAGGKTSNSELDRRSYLFYNAAAVRINRFSIVGTSEFLWDIFASSKTLSLSAGYKVVQKENLTLSAAIGFNYYRWKYNDFFFQYFDENSFQNDPALMYYASIGKWTYLGPKGGIFLETPDFQIGVSGHIHGYTNNLIFHGQYKGKVNKTWSFKPTFRVQGFQLTRAYEVRKRNWIIDLQNSIVFKEKISAILGYRNIYRIHSLILGTYVTPNDRFGFGYTFDIFRIQSFAEPNSNWNINSHELLVKVNFLK